MRIASLAALGVALALAAPAIGAEGGRVISTGPVEDGAVQVVPDIVVPHYGVGVVGAPVVVTPGQAGPVPYVISGEPNVVWVAGPDGQVRPQTFELTAHARTLETERVAFLGLGINTVSPTLAEQLRLPRGLGLVVDYVKPGSPADEAGVRVHDVLTRMDDQMLVLPEQLTTLVRMRKGGDKVGLTLIRAGQEQKVSATLTEEDRPVLTRAPQAVFSMAARPGVPPQPLDTFFRGGAAASASATMTDGEHTLTLTDSGGDRHFTVKDAGGNVLFDGPVNTDEDLAKVPPELRQKLDRMHGLRASVIVSPGPSAPPPPTP
jgi:hypothetical protein